MKFSRGLKGTFGLFFLFMMSCATEPSYREQGIGVAVYPFEDLSPGEHVGADMGELLYMQVIETVQAKGIYKVVERERLDIVLEELRLGTESVVDESTRLRVGQMLGAQLMIFPTYMVIEDRMRLDLRLVEVETTLTRSASKVTSATQPESWLELAEEVAEELLAAPESLTGVSD